MTVDNPVAVTVIVAYLVGVTLVGVMLVRRASSAGQWTVGGGGMGLFMIAVGVAGTRIGGAGTYGVAGNVITGGVWNLWWYAISTFLALALVGLFFAVPYRRLRLQTVGEIFTLRFGTRRNQALTSLCVQTEYFIVNIIEAYIIGIMLSALFGFDMAVGVVIAAIILISYVTFGGLWAAAATNLIHCAVIIFGLGAVAALGIYKLGGWGAVVEQVNTQLAGVGRDHGVFWNFTGLWWGAALGMVFSTAIHTPAASVYTNFSTAAKSARLLVPGFLLAATLAAAMPLLAGLIGVLTLAEYGPNVGLRSYATITHFATGINPLVGGVALAAVLAAVISSGGPILLSSATMFVRDWLPFTRNYSNREKLRAYRITTIIYGIIAAILAYYVSKTGISVLDLLLFGFTMVVPPAIAVAYLIYWRGTTEQGAFWGMASGYAAGLVWFVLIKLALFFELDAPEDASPVRKTVHFLFARHGEGVDPSYAATFVPLFVVPIVSILTAGSNSPNDSFYRIISGKEDMAPEADD